MAEKNRRKQIGIVIKNQMEKSIVVKIDRRVTHPVYGRVISKSSTVMAHDEKNECQIGDKVSIIESHPLSKRKHWRLIKILEKAK